MSILDGRWGLFRDALLVVFGTGVLLFNLNIPKVVTTSFHKLQSISMECIAAAAFESCYLFHLT